MAALTCVTGTLKELCVVCSDVPACLSALTGLEALQIQCIPDNDREAAHRLKGALPHLQRLTRLDLGLMPRVPATITSLQHLADLRLSAIQGPLPGGSWLSGLRSLELCRCNIGAAWQDVRQLERLQLKYFNKEDEEFLTQTLRWAAKNQSLRRLQLITNETLPYKAREALRGMQRRRPQLHIAFKDWYY